jgi:putative transcriptional regulator
MISHHPDDDLLLIHSAGRLASAPAIVVAAHVEMCEQCRGRVKLAEQLGGVLLEESPPAPVSDEVLDRTIAAIDTSTPSRPSSRSTAGFPPSPAGVVWPRSLARCDLSRWHWLAPGMRWSRVTVPWDKAANVLLLRIAAGKNLAWHTHSERELTLVLHGCFSDGRTRLGPGDFDETDPSVHHQPVVETGSECICLASIEGHVLFDGWLARRLGDVIGM